MCSACTSLPPYLVEHEGDGFAPAGDRLVVVAQALETRFKLKARFSSIGRTFETGRFQAGVELAPSYLVAFHYRLNDLVVVSHVDNLKPMA